MTENATTKFDVDGGLLYDVCMAGPLNRCAVHFSVCAYKFFCLPCYPLIYKVLGV